MELWWGDERFVPADDADRNAKQALDLLAERLRLNPDRIHVMPASGGELDLDQAAEAYAKELGSTVFDVCLLGMGPDGHVASIFPEHPSSYATGDVIAVRAAPKRPGTISLTLPVITAARGLVHGQRRRQLRPPRWCCRRRTGPGAGRRRRCGRAHFWLLDRDAVPATDLQRGLI